MTASGNDPLKAEADKTEKAARRARNAIKKIKDESKKQELKDRVIKARDRVKEVVEKPEANTEDFIKEALKEIQAVEREARAILQEAEIEAEKKANKKAIRVVEGNARGGNDLVIGDVHGNRECLQAVLDTLGENDRLFLVGDLTDRGSDSPGVIELLNSKKYAGKVFAIRGNHEDICLDGISALEKMIMKVGGVKELEELSEDCKSLNNEDFRKKYSDFRILDLALNGGDWMIHLFLKEVQEWNIKTSGNVAEYQEDSQVKAIKTYMENLPYIMQVKGDKPFNVVHADMPITDQELKLRVEKGVGLTKDEIHHASWAREKELRNSKTERTKDSIPTYVGHNIVAFGNVQAVRPETNTINTDVGSYETDVSLVVNVTQQTCDYIGKGRDKALVKGSNLRKVKDRVNEHLSGKPSRTDREKRAAQYQANSQAKPKIKHLTAQSKRVCELLNIDKEKYNEINKNKPTIPFQIETNQLNKLNENINKLSEHIAKLREQDFDGSYLENGKKVLVKYHDPDQNAKPDELNPIHINEAEVQAIRYLRAMLLIAKHTNGTVQQFLLEDINKIYNEYVATKSINGSNAALTLELSRQFALSISERLGVKHGAKQLTMARDLGIMSEDHPVVCTISESANQVTIEKSTPYKVQPEYYENQELFDDIPNQHWFRNANRLAGFGASAKDTWLQAFFTNDFKDLQARGVSAPPSARWMPTPANNQVVEIRVADKKENVSEMEFTRTRVVRTGVAIPYDVRKLKWWKSADKEQQKIAKAKLKELMSSQLDDRIKEYKALYGDVIDKNNFNFYVNYQTLLSPLIGIDDFGPHIDNNKKFIDLVKEVMNEIDHDDVFKQKFKAQGANIIVRHTNAAVNRNASKKILGKTVITTHEYGEDDKTRREKITEMNKINSKLQDIEVGEKLSPALLKELFERDQACKCLQDLLDNKEPYKSLDRYQRNIMMAALEHLAMGSQSLTLAGCKSARDRTGIFLCAVKVMQENPEAMKKWAALEAGIVKSLQQGHGFRSMIFHSAIVKVSLVHKRFMGQLDQKIQENIGDLLIFSRKPPTEMPEVVIQDARGKKDTAMSHLITSERESIKAFLDIIQNSRLDIEQKNKAIARLNVEVNNFNSIKSNLHKMVDSESEKGDYLNSIKSSLKKMIKGGASVREDAIKAEISTFNQKLDGILFDYFFTNSQNQVSQPTPKPPSVVVSAPPKAANTNEVLSDPVALGDKPLATFISSVQDSSLGDDKKKLARSEARDAFKLFITIITAINIAEKSKSNPNQIQEEVTKFNRVLDSILVKYGVQNQVGQHGDAYSLHEYERDFGANHPHLKVQHETMFRPGAAKKQTVVAGDEIAPVKPKE